MKKQKVSHNACYTYPLVFIPLESNTPSNRIDVRIFAYSDVSAIEISLYEHRGLYWFSFTLEDGKILNSVGFCSLQNCVASLRGSVRDLGFALDNYDCIARFVKSWSLSERKAV